MIITFNIGEFNNKYYECRGIIHKEAWMNDAVVSKDLAEEMLEEDFIDTYNPDDGFPVYLAIVEAFDKVFVALHTYGDGIDTCAIDMDGEVYGAFGNFACPDLQTKSYYMGDETVLLGNMEPYDTDDQWVWHSVQYNCQNKQFIVSKATMKEFIDMRKDYLMKILKGE